MNRGEFIPKENCVENIHKSMGFVSLDYLGCPYREKATHTLSNRAISFSPPPHKKMMSLLVLSGLRSLKTSKLIIFLWKKQGWGGVSP